MKNNKPLLFVALFALLSTIMIGLFFMRVIKRNESRQSLIKGIDVKLRGKVIKKDTVKNTIRPCTIITVDLDYSNKDDFFILNKQSYTYLKIKDNIAMFVVPVEFSKLDSIAVNMNESQLEQLYFKGNLIVEYPTSFSYAYLKEKELLNRTK